MSKPKAVKGTKKTAKAKQIEIPMEGKGVAAPPVIKAIEDAADEYVEARDARQAALVIEVEKKAKLMAAMHENKAQLTPGDEGVSFYQYDGRIVSLEPEGETVRVKKLKDTVTVTEDDE